MTLLSMAALSLTAGTGLVLWLLAGRFATRYRQVNGQVPPPSWMFRSQADPELESPRRYALALLPIFLVAGVVYILNV